VGEQEELAARHSADKDGVSQRLRHASFLVAIGPPAPRRHGAVALQLALLHLAPLHAPPGPSLWGVLATLVPLEGTQRCFVRQAFPSCAVHFD
jgi:hypothetical protein